MRAPERTAELASLCKHPAGCEPSQSTANTGRRKELRGFTYHEHDYPPSTAARTTRRLHARRTAGRDLDHRRLGGLLLPAVQAARESGRRTQCQNNMKQIGLAYEQFHLHKKHYPAGTLKSKPDGDPVVARLRLVAANLLPYTARRAIQLPRTSAEHVGRHAQNLRRPGARTNRRSRCSAARRTRATCSTPIAPSPARNTKTCSPRNPTTSPTTARSS